VHAWRVVLVVAAASLLGAACVAPARTESSYEGKAADTADAVVSAARTVLLTARAGAENRSFAPIVSVTVANAGTDAASARDAFVSIQPPDARSDALRRRLLPELQRAVDTIELVRIAARRAELDRLPEIAAPLGDLADRLERFATTHG
jgi:hypothetical protein